MAGIQTFTTVSPKSGKNVPQTLQGLSYNVCSAILSKSLAFALLIPVLEISRFKRIPRNKGLTKSGNYTMVLEEIQQLKVLPPAILPTVCFFVTEIGLY